MSLSEFLLARIAEDEAAIPSGDCQCGDGEPQRPDCADRIVAECEAKRKIVNMAARQSGMCPPDDWPASGDMSAAAVADSGRWFLRTLATPYADHPDYRQEWTP